MPGAKWGQTSWNIKVWAEKGYCKAMQGNDMAIQKALSSQKGFGKAFLKARWGRGCFWVHDQIMHSKKLRSWHLVITSWQIDGETMQIVTDFIFLGSKITADGECSHELTRRLLLGRKAMTNIDSIFKNRDIANRGLSSQSHGFSSSHVWIWEFGL